MKKNDIRSLTLTAVFAAVVMLMSLIPQIGFITVFPGVSVTLVHVPVLIGVFLLPKRYSWFLGLFFGLGSLIASAMYGATPFDYAFIYPWISILPRIVFAVAAAYIYDGFKWLFTKFKDARVVSFSIIALITIFAFVYGIKAVTANSSTDISSITLPLSLVLATIFIGLYFNFIVKDREEYNIYPSAIILSTLVHTVLVLGTVALFRPGLFYDTFGTSQSVVTILYSIAAANGLIEALVATIIGVPIIIGLKNVDKKY